MSESIGWFLAPIAFVVVIAMIGAGIASWNDGRLIKRKCADCGAIFRIRNEYKDSQATNHKVCSDCERKYWNY